MDSGGISLLIHDIYQRNVKLGRGPPAVASGKSRPFKTIYATDRIEVDTRVFDSIPGAVSSEEADGNLFKRLGMPMSTSCVTPPVVIFGPNDQKKPYVDFWGAIKIVDKKVSITINNRNTSKNKSVGPLATVSFDSMGEREYNINATQEIVQRKALVGYNAGKISLEEAYMKSTVFEDNGDFVLPEVFVNEALDKFFKQIVPMLKKHVFVDRNDITSGQTYGTKPMAFKVFVLPTKDRVEWDVVKATSDKFIDVFGNRSSVRAPNKPTINSKFLSVDDGSFTLMCKKDASDLYEELNLSKESYVLINLHNEDLFDLSDLEWYFGTDVDAKNRKRQTGESESEEQMITLSKIKKHGFYTQIHDMAMAGCNDHRIMCLNRDQNKVEILLNEHCPLAAIKDRLGEIREERLRDAPLSLESLIVMKKNNRKTDWSLYMESVRALLHGRKIARYRIIARLTHIMNEAVREWKKGKISANKLAKMFPPGLFCLEAIADGGGSEFARLENDEHFAYCVGQAVMHFALWHADKNLAGNALLTRPVYDRATLRSVLSKMVFRLGLKLDDEKTTNTRMKCAYAISQTGNHDISDRGSRTDLSYFFHAGAFSVIGSTSRGKEVEGGAGAG